MATHPRKNSHLILFLTFLVAGWMFTGCTKPSSEKSDNLPQIKEFFIPLSDGVRLAGDLYIPADFDSSRSYPIILEYLPYRKDEHQRSRYGVFNYFVQRDYLVARVDIRGTGRSEGLIVPYEYSDVELDDGEEVIDYLSKLPFSNGSIALFGISWGGFNGLQLGMRNPTALKTIISLMSTDDLYEDDVHFMDGILHIDAYEIGRDMDNAMPRSPDFLIDSSYFANRFDSEPWFLGYKKQQTDGPFWDRASLNSHYEDFKTPTFLIAGLYDGYRDIVERFMDSVRTPKRALIGPWNHTWPHTADPAPTVEWRKEVVDWLDYWMLPNKTKNSYFPELIYYQRDYHAPGSIAIVPGEWKVIDKWEDLNRDQLSLYPAQHSFSKTKPVTEKKDPVTSKPSEGVEGGGPVMWWGDWAEDQALFDANCLVYEVTLDSTLSIAGYPQLSLTAVSPSPHVNWIVRLNDVAPDGQVTQITGAAFNSTHRNSSSNPAPNPINEPYSMDIDLHWTTWTFQPGHKLRIAISNAQWPMFWPAPTTETNWVITGGMKGSKLTLPLSDPSARTGYTWEAIKPDPKMPEFDVVQGETHSGFAEVNETIYDTLTQTRKVVAANEGEQRYPWGVYHNYESITHTTSDLDPAHTSVEANYSTKFDLGQRTLFLETALDFRSDADSFYYSYQRKLFENDSLLRTKTWNESFPRVFQ